MADEYFRVKTVDIGDTINVKYSIGSVQTRKAKQTAKEIINSPVKVKPSATREIMKEMKNILTRTKKLETNISYYKSPPWGD